MWKAACRPLSASPEREKDHGEYTPFFSFLGFAWYPPAHLSKDQALFFFPITIWTMRELLGLPEVNILFSSMSKVERKLRKLE